MRHPGNYLPPNTEAYDINWNVSGNFRDDVNVNFVDNVNVGGAMSVSLNHYHNQVGVNNMGIMNANAHAMQEPMVDAMVFNCNFENSGSSAPGQVCYDGNSYNRANYLPLAPKVSHSVEVDSNAVSNGFNEFFM